VIITCILKINLKITYFNHTCHLINLCYKELQWSLDYCIIMLKKKSKENTHLCIYYPIRKKKKRRKRAIYLLFSFGSGQCVEQHWCLKFRSKNRADEAQGPLDRPPPKKDWVSRSII
jgi:hypothetical protein